jgi:hypothetical protein
MIPNYEDRQLLMLVECLAFVLSVAAPTFAKGPNYVFQCHGSDEGSRESGLCLDMRDTADRGGDFGESAIVVGDPDKSVLIHRISTIDDSQRMPPAETKPPLEASQIELKKWIAAGARYEKHWPLKPPLSPTEPEVANTTWPRNAVDKLVAARLEREQLFLSPDASRATLPRSVYLDLIYWDLITRRLPTVFKAVTSA